MPSPTDLANRALLAMGSRSQIPQGALTTSTLPEAVCANKVFQSTADELMSKAWWNFARQTAVLTLLKTRTAPVWDATQPAPPWMYSYAYPADCLQARYIDTSSTNITTGIPLFTNQGFVAPSLLGGSPIRFVVANDQDGGGNDITVILTNQPNAVLVYNKQIINTQLWGPQFCDAFVYSLASYMVLDITGDRGRAKDLFDISRQKLAVAQASDGNEGLTVQQIVPDTLTIRGAYLDPPVNGPFGSIS